MNLSEMIRNNKEYSKKFGFYISLGYGEKAAQVLSVLTYGKKPLKELIYELGDKNIIDSLYGWLLETEGSDPERAVNDWAQKKNRHDIYDDEPARGGFFRGLLGGMGNRSKTRARLPERSRGLVSVAEDTECVEPPEEPVLMDAAVAVPAEPLMKMAEPPENTGTLPGPAVINAAIKELQEATSTDSYEKIEEKDAKSPLTSPTSTFRMTTNTSSMGIVLNQIRSGRNVDISQVRIEELLNYFDYDEESPEDEIFKIDTQLCTVAEDRELLYVYAGSGGKVKDHQNIVLLLDVSGSMSSRNVVTQEVIATVVSKLKKNDRFSLITYSSNDETVYDGFEIKGEGDKEDVMGRILSIVISGCTNGSAGIETAYKIGAKYYDKDGNNQVILITDGDLNFGVTKKDGLKELIEEKKKTGLFLSVIGTGLYNYKDDKLEVLSKHGNGTYCVVNTLEDVKGSVDRRYVSLTNVVAKDVKAQVEFNPRFVKTYRLLGYENRSLSYEDFKNDKVISEPYGAGGHGVALYEIVRGDGSAGQELKYQTAVLSDSDELCTVKIRFKAPLSDESTEISKTVDAEASSEESGNIRLARFLYCLGEMLRKSDKLSAADREFYKSMAEGGQYRRLPGGNEEALALIVDYLS